MVRASFRTASQFDHFLEAMSVLNVHFFAAINQQTVQSLIQLVGQGMNHLQQQGAGPTHLVLRISSPGGSSDHGLLAYNILRQLPIQNKIAIGMGNVDSAAILPFLACDTRVSFRNCRFLIHESKASGQYVEMTHSKLKEQLQIMKSINEAYSAVIAERINKTKLICKKWMSQSGVMDADKAKARNFINEVVLEDYTPEGLLPNMLTFTVTITDPVPVPQPVHQTTLSY